MVDLVKIRKKAKKLLEGVGGDAPQPSAAPDEASAPPAEPHTSHTSHTSHQTPPTEPIAAAPPPGPPPTPAATNKLEKFKEQAGKRREIAQATEQTVSASQLELLTFVLAGEHYAVDIEHIVEIVTPRNVTRIPNADLSVVGIMSLRGTIVTLVDVRRKLRHAAAGEANEDTRVVVVDFHGETVGFVVDRVLRVVKLAAGAVEPHPVVHVSEQDDSVRGVFRVGNALTILLDLDKLLDSRALAATNIA